MKLKDLKERYDRTVAEMRGISNAADPSEAELTRFDELKSELETVEAAIKRQELLDSAERRMQGEPLDNGAGDFDRELRSYSLQKAIVSRMDPGAVDASREIEVSQELARRSGRSTEGIIVPLSALIPQTENRVLTVGGDGSNLVTTQVLVNEFIDALRPASITTQLGARIITGLTDSIALPKMDALTPAAEWVAENSALTPGDHSFTQVAGAPKHCGVITELSRKLLLQSNPGIEQLIRQDFTAKLGTAVDLAVLKGSGAPQPTGITATSNIGTKASSGADPSWADVVEVMSLVESADVPQAALGWAMHATPKKKFRSTQKATNEPVYLMGDDNTMGGAPVAVTSQLDGGFPNASPPGGAEVIFGAWNEVIIAFWGGVEILVNPFAETPYSKGNVQIRGFIDADVLVRHPQAFVHWEGVGVA